MHLIPPDRRFVLPRPGWDAEGPAPRACRWRRLLAGRAAFTFGDVGGCGCNVTCSQTFTVLGCNSLGVAGVTVAVYTASGGTLLASGATDATGHVTLSWAGAGGAYWVTITGGLSGRFVAYAQSMTMTCGHTTTITLTAASGYTCIPTCAVPLKNTIVATYAGQVFTLVYGTYTFFPGGTIPVTLTGWANAAPVGVTSAAVPNNAPGGDCTCVSGLATTYIAAVPAAGTGLNWSLIAGFAKCGATCFTAAPSLANLPVFSGSCGGGILATGTALTCPDSTFAASGTFPASYPAGFASTQCGSPGSAVVGTPGGGGAFTSTE